MFVPFRPAIANMRESRNHGRLKSADFIKLASGFSRSTLDRPGVAPNSNMIVAEIISSADHFRSTSAF